MKVEDAEDEMETAVATPEGKSRKRKSFVKALVSLCSLCSSYSYHIKMI